MSDVDIAAIRAALAAATQVPKDVDTLLEWFAHDREFRTNAPTWLAALCDEIERLRAENAELRQSLEASET